MDALNPSEASGLMFLVGSVLCKDCAASSELRKEVQSRSSSKTRSTGN